MEGMGRAVECMKDLARAMDPRIRFSSPVVRRIGGCGGEELAFVVVNVHIPKEMDGMAFRHQFFDDLVDRLSPDQSARLAVGVRRLRSTS